MDPVTDKTSAKADLAHPYWRRNLKVLPLSNLLASLGFGIS